MPEILRVFIMVNDEFTIEIHTTIDKFTNRTRLAEAPAKRANLPISILIIEIVFLLSLGLR